jgi:hypothetical protein
MTIYKIYDAEDNSVVLRKGTLNECRIALHQWIDDNNDEGWEIEKFEEHPRLESFLSSPQEFINENGDTDVEIYSDWIITSIYTFRDSGDNITINKLELASELASKKLEAEWSESIKIFNDEEADVLTYTEEAQNIFNEYYDDYLSLIESCKSN